MASFALSQTAIPHWLRTRQLGQLPLVINVLLIVWLAWMAARLSWLLVPATSEGQPVAAVPAAPIQRQEQEFDEREIAGWHVFGLASEEKPVKVAPVEAPETRLQLTLRGLFASDEPEQARAIVGDPRGQEKSYAIGDPLPGGAKLSEIYPDRIILERGGRFETLRLPKELMESGPNPAERRGLPAANSPRTTNRVAAFNRYRKEIKQNPASILNYVRATPARQAGKFVGFNIQPGAQPGALEELGLQPGDIVTAINGMGIDSPATGMKAMQSLGEGDTASVTLLRGGQEMSLSLTLPSSQ